VADAGPTPVTLALLPAIDYRVVDRELGPKNPATVNEGGKGASATSYGISRACFVADACLVGLRGADCKSAEDVKVPISPRPRAIVESRGDVDDDDDFGRKLSTTTYDASVINAGRKCYLSASLSLRNWVRARVRDTDAPRGPWLWLWLVCVSASSGGADS